MFCIVVRGVEDKRSTPLASQDEDVISKINSTKKGTSVPLWILIAQTLIVPHLFSRLLSASEPLAISPEGRRPKGVLGSYRSAGTFWSFWKLSELSHSEQRRGASAPLIYDSL